jgi:tetratricopeptide (TPR) repeat protein
MAAIAVLLGLAVGLQVWRDRGWEAYQPATPVMWLRASPALTRATLGFETLVADLYWIRTVVYFGRQRLNEEPDKNYDLLVPLLDLVTTFDPRFEVAYRFGAIFLSEAPPGGPGRPDAAVALLERAIARYPDKWQYLHDAGFVHYWHLGDYTGGAEWLERASRVPGAPVWLASTAAMMHEEGGNRDASRMLWRQLRESAENEFLEQTATIRLLQLDALDAIDELNVILWRFEARAGRLPTDWQELVRAQLLRAVPLDPAGVRFEIDHERQQAQVARHSPLWPMPSASVAAQR